MNRQTPRYESIRDYMKSVGQRQEEFDIKEEFDEELWGRHLERLYHREEVSPERGTAFYRERLEQLCRIVGSSPVVNYLKYKSLPKFCDFDCDGTVRKDYLKQGFYSWFPREIYRILWNWKDLCRVQDVDFKHRTIKQFGPSCYMQDKLMGPDTINSFWITFSAYLILKYPETYRWNNFKNTVFFREGENGRQRDRSRRIIELIEADADYVASADLQALAAWTHTLGNMTLVPARFNGYRGTQPCIKDYFDLSLDNLANGWDGSRYLGAGEERTAGFVQYVNTFFLWDYVDEAYAAIPLCASHAEQIARQHKTGRLEARGVLPREDEIDGLCRTVNEKIRRRGIFMAAMLRLALGIGADGEDVRTAYVYDGSYREQWADWNVSGIYKKLMEEVFLVRQRYADGYRGAAEAIVECVRGSADEAFVYQVMDEVRRG